jgi:CheY-like chemotaxis protein
MNGLEVLKRVKEINPEVRVVVMTAFESARDAVEILKAGADDYLIKPTRETDIAHLLVRVHESLTLHREEGAIREEIEQAFDTSAVVFRSREIMRVLQTAARCAASCALNCDCPPGRFRYSTSRCATASATSRPRSSSTSASARSMPAVTPAEVQNRPSRT